MVIVINSSSISCIVPGSDGDALNVNTFITRLQGSPKKKSIPVSQNEALQLCNQAKNSFLKQNTLLKIKSPLKICGDVHGQFRDVLKIFDLGGCPSTTSYLFLGDYVDRGKNSLETICLLLALKIKYPESFFLLRGNHEIAPLNRIFGFYKEIKRRFKNGDFLKIYLKFNEVFSYMPLAAVIDKRVFCCHGGLSPLLKTLNCISKIERPVNPCKSGLASDLLWSDPDNDIDEWERQDQPDTNNKHRGIGYLWGITAHEEFLKKNKLEMMIRAHECVHNGYRWSFGKQLVTVFSAPNYSNDNYAAIATYSNKNLEFQTFR